MGFKVEVRVHSTGSGGVDLFHRDEDERPDRDDDRDAALAELDALVAIARDRMGAPPAPPREIDAGYRWMRETLQGVAGALGIAAPYAPSGNEYDTRWGRNLVEQVKTQVTDAETAMGKAVAYVRAAAEVEAARLRDLVEELEREAASFSPGPGAGGPAQHAYVDAAKRVRGAFLDRTVDMAKAGEPLIHPEFRDLVTELASVLGVPRAPVEPLIATLTSALEKARGLEAGHQEVLATLRQRNADYDRMADTAWVLISSVMEHAAERQEDDWLGAARRWSDFVHGAETVPPDNRWLVEKWLAANDMVLVTREQADRAGVPQDWPGVRIADGQGLSVLRGGSMTMTTPGDPLGLADQDDGDTVTLDEVIRGTKLRFPVLEFGVGDDDAHFFTADPKAGGKSAWADLMADAARDGRLHMAVDPSAEGLNPVFVRVGDGPGMPVVLDSAQPHETFSLRAPRARGDITPGGPLDLGDATTVLEVSRALSRFDHLFQVQQGDQGAELRSLPDRLHELMDEADRLRGLPAQRVKELANALGLSRKQRKELFRGKDDERRWGALITQMVSLLHELNRLIAAVNTPWSGESVRPGGLGDVDGWACLVDAVARMSERLGVLQAAAADELGDPSAETLADWLVYAVEQAEEKIGVATADAVGAMEWPAFVSAVAEHVLLCAAGVRQAADERDPACPSVSPGGVACGGRHRHESADGSLVWADDEEPYTPQAVRDLEHELDLRTEALIRALKLTDDERTAMRADAGDNAFRQWQYALTLAASARKAMSTYGLSGGMSDDLTAHLALPSIELQELRERLDQAAPVDRWRLVLDVVQQRCAAFAAVKSLVQPWNGTMRLPSDVTEAVRVLAEEKHAAQLAEGESPDERVRQAFFGQVAESRSPAADTSELITRDGFWRGVAARLVRSGDPVRDAALANLVRIGVDYTAEQRARQASRDAEGGDLRATHDRLVVESGEDEGGADVAGRQG